MKIIEPDGTVIECTPQEKAEYVLALRKLGLAPSLKPLPLDPVEEAAMNSEAGHQEAKATPRARQVGFTEDHRQLFHILEHLKANKLQGLSTQEFQELLEVKNHKGTPPVVKKFRRLLLELGYPEMDPVMVVKKVDRITRRWFPGPLIDDALNDLRKLQADT